MCPVTKRHLSVPSLFLPILLSLSSGVSVPSSLIFALSFEGLQYRPKVCLISYDYQIEFSIYA